MNRKLFSAFAGRVDRSTGIISGVSVATIGEARGHGVKIDQTTLAQIKEAADKSGTIKVGLDHFSGFNGIAGSLREFRVEGDHLRADLHLLENHPARERILEMAEKMPATFGLSISYLGTDEEKDGAAFARVTELLSVDLVSDPAANPTGLFASSPEALELRRRHVAEAEALRAQVHSLEVTVLERDARINDLARQVERLTRRCAMFDERMEEMASMRAAEIVASTGTATPAPITPRGDNPQSRLTGLELAKSAMKSRKP